MSRNFKNIKAWRHADELAILVYSRTKTFPKEELYGLTSQLRRAAVSVPTNITEGAGREYLLHFSKRVGYLNDNDYKELENLRTETARTLFGLTKSVKKVVDDLTK
ncbi:MAG: four helix bundle protein [Planctomycetota bacterium]|jgi:hypothetical protein